MTERCRFAPTPSGPAHPGTLLAGLLCWLDARSRGAELLLRMEDLDHTRCSAEAAAEMRAALQWLGLDWDDESTQSERGAAHEAALDRLAERGMLYACACSRSRVRGAGTPAADGGWRYPGTCRRRGLPAGGWREADAALRLRLPAGRVEVRDESGSDLSQDVRSAMGDPVLRRRNGVIAYHLAVVVDDADDGVTRVVRGRDLAASTPIHCVLQQNLGLPTPRYRHHLLLLEKEGGKLAKLHAAVGWRELRDTTSAGELCGFLAWLAGLVDAPTPTAPHALLEGFHWSRVSEVDVPLRWDGRALVRL